MCEALINYFSRVMFGPANVKIKLCILYPAGSHGKKSLPQNTAFNAFVLEQERVYYCSLDYLEKALPYTYLRTAVSATIYYEELR